MSIFSETIIHAIGEYRALLRRHCDQVERMKKIQKFGLRDSHVYENEVTLYTIAHEIVEDITLNMTMKNPSYYAYSGVQQFCVHLKQYLSNYEVENNQVVHRTQKASRAVLNAVQVMNLSEGALNDDALNTLYDCNKTVAAFGSEEQCDLLAQALARQQAIYPGFYTRVLTHLESLMTYRRSQAA